MSGSPSIDQIGLARCTGCGGCESSCARGAVALSLSTDGFYEPIVSRDRCNDCGQCAAVCPALPDEDGAKSISSHNPSAFAAWASDDRVRGASSSGGIFSELARAVIDAGGAVVGCVWGDEWTPKHVVARTWEAVGDMRGSKYVPSQMGSTYRQVLSELRDNDSRVLFSGTPCQVAAMSRALGPRHRDRALLVDFFCHGVPSLRAFHAYQRELFSGEKIASYTFRAKTLGCRTVVAESITGRHYERDILNDHFGRGFVLENLYLMEACYRCSFSGLPRPGDITLGDYWGCPDEWRDKRGVSLVLVNTPAGQRALTARASSGAISLNETDLVSAIAHNRCGTHAVHRIPRHRGAFLDGVAAQRPFTELASKYFAGRWELRWRSFRESDAKARFVLRVARDLMRRIFGREHKHNGDRSAEGPRT